MFVSIRNPQNLGTFREALLAWYDVNRRDLPWRRTTDPYRIWVSEIMLQQTRVGAVLEHYKRFFERFPNVQSLAQAKEEQVLAAWSGLGYYRRARNLHACAKVLVAEHVSKLPSTAKQLRKLPGIGRYTAAAIASIAFQQPEAVVDGNVERVLGRIAGRALSLSETWSLAGELLSPERPGDFNQAMMELGATVCLAGEPKCLVCPVMKFCRLRGSHARQKPEQRQSKSICVVLAQKKESVWLVQRAESLSLMPGMWELPESSPNGRPPEAKFKHSILNTDFEVSVFLAAAPSGKGRWVRKSSLGQSALTGLTRKILRHFKWI